MKVTDVSFYFSYDGSVTGNISFRGAANSVVHKLTEAQVAEARAMFARWQSQVLDDAAANLIQARDDLLAIEHTPDNSEGCSS